MRRGREAGGTRKGHSRDAGCLERGDEAADHGGHGAARDDLAAGGSERGEHADLDAERGQVREAAERVRRDRERAVGQRVAARLDRLELCS